MAAAGRSHGAGSAPCLMCQQLAVCSAAAANKAASVASACCQSSQLEPSRCPAQGQGRQQAQSPGAVQPRPLPAPTLAPAVAGPATKLNPSGLIRGYSACRARDKRSVVWQVDLRSLVRIPVVTPGRAPCRDGQRRHGEQIAVQGVNQRRQCSTEAEARSKAIAMAAAHQAAPAASASEAERGSASEDQSSSGSDSTPIASLAAALKPGIFLPPRCWQSRARGYTHGARCRN